MRSGAENRIDDTVDIFQKRYRGYVEDTLELLNFLELLVGPSPRGLPILGIRGITATGPDQVGFLEW